MQTYQVTLTGETPLLHHNHNLEWITAIEKWLKEPGNKKLSKAGDDRTPGFMWIGHLYHFHGVAVVPSDNLMTMLREGGKKCPTGKGKETFGRLTQSGIVVDQTEWPIVDAATGKPYSVEGLDAMATVNDYEQHEAWAAERGFSLFAKGARVNQTKHVRVRPRFDRWAVTGTMTVLEEQITRDVLLNILQFAGRYAGLGDWRPSAPKNGGPFGRFTASVKVA